MNILLDCFSLGFLVLSDQLNQFLLETIVVELNIQRLYALLEAIAPTSADTVITLGDYVDRGPDACGVIDRLIELHHDARDAMEARASQG